MFVYIGGILSKRDYVLDSCINTVCYMYMIVLSLLSHTYVRMRTNTCCQLAMSWLTLCVFLSIAITYVDINRLNLYYHHLSAFSHAHRFTFSRPTAYTVCYSARYMLSPVRPSVRPSHGWISQRRLHLGSRNLHHTVTPW